MARTRSASFLYFSGFFLYIKMCFSLQPSQDFGFVGLDGKLKMYKTESKEQQTLGLLFSFVCTQFVYRLYQRFLSSFSSFFLFLRIFYSSQIFKLLSCSICLLMYKAACFLRFSQVRTFYFYLFYYYFCESGVCGVSSKNSVKKRNKIMVSFLFLSLFVATHFSRCVDRKSAE